MKLFIAGFLMLFSLELCAQAPDVTGDTQVNQWKKAVVKIESIQQRYNFRQVDSMLQKQTDTIKAISQHEKYSIQGELLTLRDTIRGTGILVSDGNKIYLITAKHLIKATENAPNDSETINNLIWFKTNIDNKISNDVSLSNLSGGLTFLQPFVFSPDQNDLGIISFQRHSDEIIIAYIKQEGCVPIPIQSISNIEPDIIDNEILTIGFPALPGKEHNNPAVTNGKIASNDKTSSCFKVDLNVYPGSTGGPVIKNNKLIGILSFQSGISTNIDAVMHPYKEASSATVIKASCILPLLRILQEHEDNILSK